MTYTPTRKSREGWDRMMQATGATCVREALVAAIALNMSESDIVETYRITRWPLRTALEAFGLKLIDGRTK